MEEAGLILFLVDGQTGITDLDQEIAQMVRRSGKPVMLVVNKVDTGAQEYTTAEFYGLGIGEELYGISANNGYGTGDLLDALMALLPAREEPAELGLPRLAVVGRPNVGKSTMISPSR